MLLLPLSPEQPVRVRSTGRGRPHTRRGSEALPKKQSLEARRLCSAWMEIVTTSTYVPAKLGRKRSRGSRAVERGGTGDWKVVRSRLMGVPCAATDGHVWVHGSTVAWVCVDVCGTCHHQRARGCPLVGLDCCLKSC